MRVTNSMITNSSQQHITNAKNLFLKYQTQYASQKKIQRPSDDPTVAVRALQLRTTYTQIRQYASKKCIGRHGLDGFYRDSIKKCKYNFKEYERLFKPGRK